MLGDLLGNSEQIIYYTEELYSLLSSEKIDTDKIEELFFRLSEDLGIMYSKTTIKKLYAVEVILGGLYIRITLNRHYRILRILGYKNNTLCELVKIDINNNFSTDICSGIIEFICNNIEEYFNISEVVCKIYYVMLKYFTELHYSIKFNLSEDLCSYYVNVKNVSDELSIIDGLEVCKIRLLATNRNIFKLEYSILDLRLSSLYGTINPRYSNHFVKEFDYSNLFNNNFTFKKDLSTIMNIIRLNITDEFGLLCSYYDLSSTVLTGL